MAELERVLQLYREGYAGFNARHFDEIVQREHRQILFLARPCSRTLVQGTRSDPRLTKWVMARR